MSRTFRRNEERDGKPWGKPPSEFKKLRRRERRHAAKNAFANGKEIERQPKNDEWDWL